MFLLRRNGFGPRTTSEKTEQRSSSSSPAARNNSTVSTSSSGILQSFSFNVLLLFFLFFLYMSTLISPGCYCLLLLLLLLDSSSKQLFSWMDYLTFFFFLLLTNDSLNVGVSKSCRMRLSSKFFIFSRQIRATIKKKRNFSDSSKHGRYCTMTILPSFVVSKYFWNGKVWNFPCASSSSRLPNTYTDTELYVISNLIPHSEFLSFSRLTNLLTVICWRWFVMWSSDDDKNISPSD